MHGKLQRTDVIIMTNKTGKDQFQDCCFMLLLWYTKANIVVREVKTVTKRNLFC